MKTFKQVLEILLMILQLAIAVMPFICGFVFVIIKMGWLNGISASEDLIKHLAE